MKLILIKTLSVREKDHSVLHYCSYFNITSVVCVQWTTLRHSQLSCTYWSERKRKNIHLTLRLLKAVLITSCQLLTAKHRLFRWAEGCSFCLFHGNLNKTGKV
jgi:hypothetical protein